MPTEGAGGKNVVLDEKSSETPVEDRKVKPRETPK